MPSEDFLALFEQFLAQTIARRAGAAMPGNRQLVTIGQLAGAVHRSRHTLRKYKGRGLPDPVTSPRARRAHLYDWTECRPWLQDTFGLELPAVFPGIAR